MIESEAEELARLRAENAALKAGRTSQKELTFKVSDKGALSVYGLQRFPVTLYREQWERLLDAADRIREFMVENTAKLARRDHVREG